MSKKTSKRKNERSIDSYFISSTKYHLPEINTVPTFASSTTNSEPCTSSSEVILKNVSSLPSSNNQDNPNCLNNIDFLSNTGRAIDNGKEYVLNEVDNIDKNVSNFLQVNNAVKQSSLEKQNDQIVNTNFALDIGLYVGKDVDDYIKWNLLSNPWKPNHNYSFPYSLKRNNKTGSYEKRHANLNQLNSYEWVVFSHDKKGFFCKYCPFFVSSGEGGRHRSTRLQKLVIEPLTNFAKVLGKDGDFENHARNKYHQEAVIKAKDFLKIYKNPELSITNKLHTGRQKIAEENRSRLVPIIKSIIFLGRQNIPFRGHRDDGKLTTGESDSVINTGNFRALLKFRIDSGDVVLKEHLEGSTSRATYISKTTQNELINCCGRDILSKIIKRIQDARIFSVMFDETTDVSNKSQLSLIIRYTLDKNIYESFIQFIDARAEMYEDNESNGEPKLTGVAIGKIVINSLKNKCNLNLNNCVAITTDGCSTMVSVVRGAVKTVMEETPNAVFSPCYNHCLNLSISRTSRVQAIKNAVSAMQETIYFLKGSSKREDVLKRTLGHKLSGLCETRWIERHDGVLQFRFALPKIISVLDLITEWKESVTAVKARGLRMALCDGQTLVAIVCLSDLLTCTLQLSQFLQGTQVDSKVAQDCLNDTIKILQRRRDNCEAVFKTIYEEVCDIAEELDVEIKIPRKASRQTLRENHPTNDIVIYYKQIIYIQALDNLILDLKDRFPKETLHLYNMHIFFSKTKPNNVDEIIHNLVTKYCSFFKESVDVLKRKLITELEFWQLHMDKEENIGLLSALDILSKCNEQIYPCIHFFIKVLVTLPISIATAERTFSCLRLLKSWLRSSMGQERLTGLALMHIHYDENIDIENVIDKYANLRNHRLDFTL